MNEKSAAGTIFLSIKTERILFNLRAPYKTHKLTWSLWGGMVEDGETPKDCLLREMKEEMGYVPAIEKFYPFDVSESKDKNFKYYSFVCVVEDEFIPQLNKESVGYCWTKLGIWPRPLHDGAKDTLNSNRSIQRLQMILSQYKS